MSGAYFSFSYNQTRNLLIQLIIYTLFYKKLKNLKHDFKLRVTICLSELFIYLKLFILIKISQPQTQENKLSKLKKECSTGPKLDREMERNDFLGHNLFLQEYFFIWVHIYFKEIGTYG